jgi:hypothetical protein
MARLEVEIGAKIEGLLTELKKAKKGLSGIGVAADKLVGKLKRVGEKMSKIGKSMATYLTLPLAAIAGASIKMASDFTESLNKVDVAFKESSKQVREFAKTTLKTFGIAQGTALDMAALFGDMATSMGVPTDKAATLATELVGLAGDMSSFKNIGIKEVTTALNGVFTGETESLKRMGIVMTIANLKTFALTQGMNDNIEAMTQAQKIQLRYAYILSVTKNAQGDFQRTSAGSANQMRIFTESVKELSVSFGKILLPLFTKIITQVNKVIKGFTSLSPATKKIIVVVATLAAVLGPLLIALGFLSTTLIPALITGFGMLVSAVVSSATAFKGLTTAMIANPITAIAVGIAALVVGFTSMVQQITPAVSKLKTFFNLIRSFGNYSQFVALQIQDQVDAMAEEGEAAKKAAAELKKFNKKQKDAADAAAKLTAKLINQNKVLATVLPTRKTATSVNTSQVGVSGNMGQESTIGQEGNNDSVVPRIDTTLFDEGSAQMLLKLQEFNESANNIIQGSIANTFSNIGSSIGEALASGGSVLSAIGSSIIQGLSNFLSDMGKKLIEYGTLAVIKGKLDLAILAGGPVAIGAGIAAIAVGVALSAAGAAIGQLSSSGSSGSSGGSKRDTGSSNFSGSSGGGNFGASSGGTGGGGTVVFEIAGTKLVGVLSKTLDRNKSLGGSLSI